MNDFKDVQYEQTTVLDNCNLQIDFLKKRLYNNNDLFNIKNIKEITYRFFDIIHDDLLTIIKKSRIAEYTFPVFLLGGVIVNTEEGNNFDIIKSFKIND